MDGDYLNLGALSIRARDADGKTLKPFGCVQVAGEDCTWALMFESQNREASHFEIAVLEKPKSGELKPIGQFVEKNRLWKTPE